MESLMLSLELTDGCNIGCLHCFKTLAEKMKHLDPDLLRDILAQLGEMGLSALVALTGGEPTLHPRLEEIISLISEAGFRYSIVTNGWNFPGCRELIEAHRLSLDALSFSLDGQEKNHDHLRMPGSYRRVVSALLWCHEHALPTQLNMVLTRENREDLKDVVRLATSLGCRALGVAHCKPTPDAISAGLVMGVEERLEMEAEIAELQQLYRLPLLLAGDHDDPHPLSLCPQLRLQSLHVDVFGRLRACCELSTFRGGAEDSDIIADLRVTPLREALALLAARTAEILDARAKVLLSGTSTKLDRLICTQCLLHDHKIERGALEKALE